MFGATIGGPVMLPHFDGRKNKTFFFLGWQGFRYRQPAQSFYRVPTQANLNGDFSDWPLPIYNPFTSRPDPNSPGSFIRDPFPGNIVPANLINPGMVAFAKATLPAPVFTGVGLFNAINTTPTNQTEEEYTARADQSLGTKDSFMFRASGLLRRRRCPRFTAD